MPPKDSKKREAEPQTQTQPPTEGLRRSTRGGGHPPPAPRPSKPASSSAGEPKSKKAKTATATTEKQTEGHSEGAPNEETVPDQPTAPTADGIVEGIGSEENGVAIPEENKEIAKEVEENKDKDRASDKPKSSSNGSGKKRIEVGENLPEGLVLKNDKDEEVTISDLTKDRGAIFFVYPRANTPGCTTQACNFRDHYAEFGPLGYEVYGLSSDSPKSQANWKAKHNFPYTLLCDPGQILLKLLGAAKSANSNQRSHYIVAKGGKLVNAQYTVSPKDSHVLALEFIKKEQQK